MRLFVAIALEDEASAALEQVHQRLAAHGEGLRWSRPADRHVTLQFLGEVAAEQAACVTERLAAVHSPQVPVRIAGLGIFASAGVFWAEVEATAELLALRQRVTAATRACGFVPESRPYRPHITLARRRGNRGGGAVRLLQRAVEQGRIRVASDSMAREFGLYESIPGPEGSRYEVWARFPLGIV